MRMNQRKSRLQFRRLASILAKNSGYPRINKFNGIQFRSAADVKMEITVLRQSLKSSILSSTSFQLDKTFWEEVIASVERSRRKAYVVAQGDGKLG